MTAKRKSSGKTGATTLDQEQLDQAVGGYYNKIAFSYQPPPEKPENTIADGTSNTFLIGEKRT